MRASARGARGLDAAPAAPAGPHTAALCTGRVVARAGAWTRPRRVSEVRRAVAARATAFPGVQNIDYLAGSAFDEDGEDYYSIFGVDPSAEKADIRKAYHSAMRECHPDFAVEDGGEAHEFATLLNEMYETLTDDERRADYDSLIGFSRLAVNPFRDDRFEADQVFVDEISCIGCTNCASVCPRSFQMQWEEHGRARAVAQGVDSDEALTEAMETCPVNCIHWVSAPQNALLETVMRKMDRVDAWLLLSGGGHSHNVFTEASLAWEKRQAQVRAREQAARTRSLFAMWEPAGGSVKPGQESGTQPGVSRDQQRFQATAERAAKAARRWRDFQRNKHQKRDLRLPAPAAD